MNANSAGWEAISTVIKSAAYKWPLRSIVNRTPAPPRSYDVTLSCSHQIKHDQRQQARNRSCPTCRAFLAENPS